MEHRASACHGCLLGLAAGDALGYTIDPKTWEYIRHTYGPNGLWGYDLANSGATISSYTQIAAYVANGLLIGITRGKQKQFAKYISMALKDWKRRQNLPGDPAQDSCWVSAVKEMRTRHCRDIRMLDALRADPLGTPEKPNNKADTPGSLIAAAIVGLAYDPKYLNPQDVAIIGAQAVALTHGDPKTFLSGAVLALLVAALLQEPTTCLQEHFLCAVDAMEQMFSNRWPEAGELATLLRAAVSDIDPYAEHQQKLEQLHCYSAAECLAGAIYTCLVCEDDFDRAMILSVNHSGRSAAVGALTGAILGAQLGVEAIPAFYLESLDVIPVLKTLATDLAQGSPTAGLFDDDWDTKYTQGKPV